MDGKILIQFKGKFVYLRERTGYIHYAFCQNVDSENIVLLNFQNKIIGLSFDEVLSCREMSAYERDTFMQKKHEAERK